jgi:hypothetical protein
MMPECCCNLRTARGAILAAMALAALVANSTAAASGCRTLPREQDELWLVNSRGLGSCDFELNAERMKYWRYDRQQSWVKSELPELVATDDPDVTTIVFLHGNRIPSCEAFTKGWTAYRTLIACADERPVRFVIWSWPSEQVCGPIEDARIKAARTNAHGYYLAWFLDRLNPEVPVGIWGHSFGARIATGALHLLGDGSLAGRQLMERSGDTPRFMRAALFASALDCDWLLPGRCHGQALSQLDDLLLVNNGCDRLLMRYELLYGRRSCREALGYVGLPTRRLPTDEAQKVSQMNAACYVGKQHQFANYLASGAIMARVRSHLLFARPAATMEAPAEATADNATTEKLTMATSADDAQAAIDAAEGRGEPVQIELALQ